MQIARAVRKGIILFVSQDDEALLTTPDSSVAGFTLQHRSEDTILISPY